MEDTDSAGFTDGNQTVRRIKKIGERHIAKGTDSSFAFDGKRRSCEPQNIRANPAACRVFAYGNGLEPKAGFGCNGSVGRNVPMQSAKSFIISEVSTSEALIASYFRKLAAMLSTTHLQHVDWNPVMIYASSESESVIVMFLMRIEVI